ncbi:MAG: Acyl-[acyl-carrier-protein]--UDP-N-acetylglucosamine O-acyltransferase [Phycisphaerae bacterium]|nr:Acyl-[acyl-carrier-protein]--UDP-N-acetylglucosamine O-acyltransferase [Phycisphaerae bacterium]
MHNGLVAIHATAIVHPEAHLDGDVEVGAYAIVEAGVRIGAGTRLYPHCYLTGHTTIGRRCQIHPFAVIGNLPQDVKHDGSRSYTVVGDDVTVREGASIHRGTAAESTTRVGDRCFLMANAHVGHNCTVDDDVVLIVGSMLGGHVSVGRRAVLGGGAGVHQFVRIGEFAMIAGGAIVHMDVPPFLMHGVTGLVGPNVVGLRRGGFSAEERNEIRACFRQLYRAGLPFRRALEIAAESMVTTPAGQRLIEFLRAPSKRGIAGIERRVRRTGDTDLPP